MPDARSKGKGRAVAPGHAAVHAVCACLLALGCGGGEPRALADSAAPAAAPVDTAAVRTDSVRATPTAVTEFIRFVEAQRADSAGAVGDVVAEGLRRLADAIAAVAPRDTSAAGGTVGARVDALRARADSVGRDSMPAEQARRTSEAFVLAGEMLQALQDLGQPALIDRGAEVRQAAAALRSDQPLAEQTGAVRNFFQRAAAALRGMVGAGVATG